MLQVVDTKKLLHSSKSDANEKIKRLLNQSVGYLADKRYNRLFLTIPFLVSFIYTVNIPTVYAQNISLTTFPNIIYVNAQLNQQTQSGFSLQNNTNNIVRLKVMIKPFEAAPSADGKLIYNPAIKLPEKIQIEDNGQAVNIIELGPKQKKDLHLIINNHIEQTRDDYFSILFLTIPENNQVQKGKDATAQTITQAGIGINVLMSIGEKEAAQGSLVEFSTDAFKTEGPVPFTVRISNNGKHYISPKGVILIKNVFGQTVGRINIANQNILANTVRSMSGIQYIYSANKIDSENLASIKENNSLINDDLENKSLIKWSEKPLFGLYKAELSLELSENGPLFTAYTSFFILPITFLITFSVVIVILVLIFLRIKYRLRKI